MFRRAKATPAERGQSLGAFVTEAIREKLSRRDGRHATAGPPWMRGFGRLHRLERDTARIQERIEYLLDFDVLAVSPATTVVYAEVRAALKKCGRPIPANDVWIAALALEHRLPVLTRDAHFEAVPGLARVAW
ncbi:MAG: PIN domain-containing protein [Vicinamibacterales bacterium]